MAELAHLKKKQGEKDSFFAPIFVLNFDAEKLNGVL